MVAAQCGSAVHKTLSRVPILNMFVLMFDQGPSFQTLEKELNMIALMAALLLTVSMAIPSSVEYSELVEADARWQSTQYLAYFANFFVSDSNHKMSDLLLERMAMMNTSFLLNLVGVLVVYMSLSCMGGSESELDEAVKDWWPAGRFVMMFLVGTLVTGIIGLFLVQSALVAIKFPDYYVESTGEDQMIQWGSQGTIDKSTIVWMSLSLLLALVHSLGVVLRDNKKRARAEGINDATSASA